MRAESLGYFEELVVRTHGLCGVHNRYLVSKWSTCVFNTEGWEDQEILPIREAPRSQTHGTETI